MLSVFRGHFQRLRAKSLRGHCELQRVGDKVVHKDQEWSERLDLNQQPLPWQGNALPGVGINPPPSYTRTHSLKFTRLPTVLSFHHRARPERSGEDSTVISRIFIARHRAIWQSSYQTRNFALGSFTFGLYLHPIFFRFRGMVCSL